MGLVVPVTVMLGFALGLGLVVPVYGILQVVLAISEPRNLGQGNECLEACL